MDRWTSANHARDQSLPYCCHSPGTDRRRLRLRCLRTGRVGVRTPRRCAPGTHFSQWLDQGSGDYRSRYRCRCSDRTRQPAGSGTLRGRSSAAWEAGASTVSYQTLHARTRGAIRLPAGDGDSRVNPDDQVRHPYLGADGDGATGSQLSSRGTHRSACAHGATQQEAGSVAGMDSPLRTAHQASQRRHGRLVSADH